MAFAFMLHHAGFACAALWMKNRLEDLFIDPPPELGPPAESIMIVRIDRSIPATGGCFATLPGGQRGYVRHGSGFREGEYGLVQVTGYRQEGKLVPLSGQIRLKGRYVVLTPDRPGLNVARSIGAPDRRRTLKRLLELCLPRGHESLGLIARTASAAASDDAIRLELHSLFEMMMRIDETRTAREMQVIQNGPALSVLAEREWAGIDGFIMKHDPSPEQRDQVILSLQACLDRSVALQGGGSMAIDVTNALICIDVNSGAATAKSAAFTTALQANRELPRQLRLRGLGGQMVIDYPSLDTRSRQRVAEELAMSFSQDTVPTRMIGWTRMGLLEMTRKRDRVPLARVMIP